MINDLRLVKALAATCTMGAVLAFLGCSSDDGVGQRYSVSGTVTYKGKPLPKGTIGFQPEEKGAARGASGEIVDGAYSLTTQTPGDGAFPGKYKVTVAARESADENAAAAELKAMLAKKGIDPSKAPANLPPEFLVKANKKTKSLIPEKYAKAETSGLTAEVKAQSNSGTNFDLTD
jgi:hypothetical protein